MAILSSDLINNFFKCCFVDNHIATQYLESIPVYDVHQADTDATFTDLRKTYEQNIDQFGGEIKSRLDNDSVVHWALSTLAEEASELAKKKANLNLSLFDYIQLNSEGPSIAEIGIYQPPQGVGDTKLTATKDDYENLRIGTVSTERESDDTVIIHATARYKPDDEDAYETDRWGYTETDPTRPDVDPDLQGISEWIHRDVHEPLARATDSGTEFQSHPCGIELRHRFVSCHPRPAVWDNPSASRGPVDPLAELLKIIRSGLGRYTLKCSGRDRIRLGDRHRPYLTGVGVLVL